MSIVSEFLNDRKQRVHLDGIISASVDVVLGVTQGSVLKPLLFILHTSELLHNVETILWAMQIALLSMQFS